jgi:hypothetical protein
LESLQEWLNGLQELLKLVEFFWLGLTFFFAFQSIISVWFGCRTVWDVGLACWLLRNLVVGVAIWIMMLVGSVLVEIDAERDRL